MNTRYCLLPRALALLCLLPAGSGSAEEKPKAADPPPASKIKVRTADDFPEGFKQFAGPLGALDRLRQRAELMRDTGAEFNRPGPQNIYRWGWLTAVRWNIEYYDKLCREAAKEEQNFWDAYNACSNPNKRFLESKAPAFGEFQKYRLELRRSWYYIASSHRWRWEKEGPDRPLNYRLVMSITKALGCTRDELETALAWFDLILTDAAPSLLYALTIPFAFLS
jgi:hypothetical protein